MGRSTPSATAPPSASARSRARKVVTSPTGVGAARRQTAPSRRATATQRLRGSTLQSAWATIVALCSGEAMGGTMPYRYTPAARWLHWTTAALVGAMIVVGVWMMYFEPKDE